MNTANFDKLNQVEKLLSDAGTEQGGDALRAAIDIVAKGERDLDRLIHEVIKVSLHRVVSYGDADGVRDLLNGLAVNESPNTKAVKAVIDDWATGSPLDLSGDAKNGFHATCGGWKQFDWPMPETVGYFWVKTKRVTAPDGSKTLEDLLQAVERLAKSKKYEEVAHKAAQELVIALKLEIERGKRADAIERQQQRDPDINKDNKQLSGAALEAALDALNEKHGNGSATQQ